MINSHTHAHKIFFTDRLYFATLRSKPRNTSSLYYFNIDDEFVYEKYEHLKINIILIS